MNHPEPKRYLGSLEARFKCLIIHEKARINRMLGELMLAKSFF